MVDLVGAWIASLYALVVSPPQQPPGGLHADGRAPASLTDVVRIAPAQRRAGINVSNHPSVNNEVAIAIDPSNPYRLVAVAHDYRNFFPQAAVWHSLDGGKSWAGAVLADLNPELGAYDGQVDPAVAAWRGGVFFCSFLDHERPVVPGGRNRLVVARSDDGGVTWPRMGVVVANEGEPLVEDKPYLAVDDSGGPFDGNVYVVWVHFPEASFGRIWLARSSDGGATFETPLELSSGSGMYTGPVPGIGPNGEVYVIWTNGNRLEGTVSTDGGVTFSVDRTVTTASRPPSPLPGAAYRVAPFGSLAVDRSSGPDRGSLYVVWADNTGVGHGPDILLRRSADGGTSWSLPVRVSDDTNGAYQIFPWVAVGPDGAVNVVFVDQRDTPLSPLYHTYLARSTDGGRSFQRNIRLTDEASDSTLDGFGGGFIGDYIGIAASPLGVYPTWTDIRASNGQPEIYVRPLRFGAP